MKNILFPTDFSENAQNAYSYALHLAEKLQASISTVHSYTPIQVPVNAVQNTVAELIEMEELEQLENYRKAAVNMHQKAIKEHLENVEVKHDLRIGAVVDVILETTKFKQSDLVVMGTKGASGFLGNLIGSNAAAVIEGSTVPVLMIPEDAHYRPIRKMVIATDLDDLEEDAIANALEFAALFNAELHCIYVNVAHNPLIGERMAKLASDFADSPKLTFEILEGSDILEEINKYLKEKDMDVLAMKTHKRTFFQKLVGISYARRMAFNTDVPLLVFH